MSDPQPIGAHLKPASLARLGIVPRAVPDDPRCCDGSGGTGHRPLVYAWTAPDGREHLRTVPEEVGVGYTAYCSCPVGEAAREAHREVTLGYGREQRGAWLNRFWRGTGLPERYDGMTLDTYPASPETAEAVARLRAWGEAETPRSLILHSRQTGTGKTGLLTCLCRERIARGETVVFRDVPDLLRTFADSWDRKGDRDPEDPRSLSQRALMTVLLDATLLVLDDLGANAGYPWEVAKLFEIVNGRYNLRRPTAITANYSPSELAGLLGDNGSRQIWRVIEDGEVVRLEGPNLRDKRRAS